jgi:hypothetical protein
LKIAHEKLSSGSTRVEQLRWVLSRVGVSLHTSRTAYEELIDRLFAGLPVPERVRQAAAVERRWRRGQASAAEVVAAYEMEDPDGELAAQLQRGPRIWMEESKNKSKKSKKKKKKK